MFLEMNDAVNSQSGRCRYDMFVAGRLEYGVFFGWGRVKTVCDRGADPAI